MITAFEVHKACFEGLDNLNADASDGVATNHHMSKLMLIVISISARPPSNLDPFIEVASLKVRLI